MKVDANGVLVGDHEERGAMIGLTGNIDESNPILSTIFGEVFLVGLCFCFCLMDKMF